MTARTLRLPRRTTIVAMLIDGGHPRGDRARRKRLAWDRLPRSDVPAVRTVE